MTSYRKNLRRKSMYLSVFTIVFYIMLNMKKFKIYTREYPYNIMFYENNGALIIILLGI